MNLESFTDEQLLNLVNNTIIEQTDYTVDMFTGGAVQTTTSHNHKITNYKVLLFFGYNDKRNPITYTEEITRDELFIWTKAITLKVESLKIDTVGSSFDKLNRRMNKKIENDSIGKEVVGIGIGKGSTNFVTTSYEEEKKDKPFSFSLTRLTAFSSLSATYKQHLKAYIEEQNRPLTYQEFVDGLEATGKKYKNFKSAYNTWANNREKWNNENGENTPKKQKGFKWA